MSASGYGNCQARMFCKLKLLVGRILDVGHLKKKKKKEVDGKVTFLVLMTDSDSLSLSHWTEGFSVELNEVSHVILKV